MKMTTTIRRSVLARCVVLARLRKLAFAGVGTLAVLALSAGTPRLSAQASLASNNGMVLADFNRDGLPDVLLTGARAFTISFGATPYGTFSTTAKTVPFPALCSTYITGSAVVGDFNGDGVPDIAMTCFGGQFSSYEVFILIGNGDGTFTNGQFFTGENNLILGDFNHDAKFDIVTEGPNANNQQTLLFYAGNGDGTFATPVTTTLPNNYYSSGVAVDLNYDGYPDIVLGNFQGSSTSTIDVFGNNKDGTFGTAAPATGTFTPSVSVPVGTYPSAREQTILVGNFFGNGPIDLAVADTGTTPGVYILANTGTTATFSFATPVKTAVTSLYGAQAASIVSPLSDLLIYNGSTLTVRANDGSGNFTNTYTSLSIGNESSTYAATDANGDGHADIYTATPGNNAAQITVSLVSGTATAVSQPFSLPVGVTAVSATWPGNINFTGATANGNQTVNAGPTTVALVSSLNPSTFGNTISLTGTVSPATSGGFTPSGTLTFTDGATTLGTASLDGSVVGSINLSNLAPGTHSIMVTYSGDSVFAGSTMSLSQVVNKITPTITWSTSSPITYGTPLSSTQLNATATSTYTDGAVPGTFAYTPTAGTVLNAGSQTLNVLFTPTDLTTFNTATGSVTLQVNLLPLALTSFTPSTAVAGASATTITITGTGFLSSTLARVNGTNIATTFVNATTLTAIIPAASLATNGTLQISLTNPTTQTVSGNLPFTVTVPQANATITAPGSTPPGSQPTINFGLTAAYPVPLTATFTIQDKSGVSSGATDPSVQFAGGGTTFTVTIPAGQLTIPAFQIQAGTIAATITVPVTLTVGSNVVNSGTLAATIIVPPAIPTATATTVARSGNQLTVTVTGFSNTREITQAKFHFVAAPGASLTTSDIVAPVGPDFAAWFANSTSLNYGSAFTYTQNFTISGNATDIGSVQVTLTNGVGDSTVYTAQ